MTMMIFKKIPEPNHRFDTTTITFEVNAVTLTDVIQEFEFFLKGCGFSFEGTLGVIDDCPETWGLVDGLEELEESEEAIADLTECITDFEDDDADVNTSDCYLGLCACVDPDSNTLGEKTGEKTDGQV